jgi:hypothetical protein
MLSDWKHPESKDGPNRYCLLSPCGAFTICKIGTADGYRYELWKGKEQVRVNLPSALAAWGEWTRIASTKTKPLAA